MARTIELRVRVDLTEDKAFDIPSDEEVRKGVYRAVDAMLDSDIAGTDNLHRGTVGQVWADLA